MQRRSDSLRLRAWSTTSAGSLGLRLAGITGVWDLRLDGRRERRLDDFQRGRVLVWWQREKDADWDVAEGLGWWWEKNVGDALERGKVDYIISISIKQRKGVW